MIRFVFVYLLGGKVRVPVRPGTLRFTKRPIANGFLVLTWEKDKTLRKDYKKATIRAAQQPGFHFSWERSPWTTWKRQRRCVNIPHWPIKSRRKPPFLTKQQINQEHVPTSLWRRKAQTVSISFFLGTEMHQKLTSYSPHKVGWRWTHTLLFRHVFSSFRVLDLFSRCSTRGLQRVTAHGTATTLRRANDEQRDTSSGVREQAWPRLATPSGNTHCGKHQPTFEVRTPITKAIWGIKNEERSQ